MADNNATCLNCNCPWIVRHHLIQYLQVVFLPPKGSILVCKYNGHEKHSLGSTSQARWLDFPSSLALCAVTCRVLNYSISTPSQLAPNEIMNYTVGLKSVKHKHYVAQLKPVLWYFKRGYGFNILCWTAYSLLTVICNPFSLQVKSYFFYTKNKI